MDRKGPSMTIPHRIVSMSSLPPPPPPPPPAMPVLPMATSLPPPPLPAAATSNRTSASTSAAEEQDYEYVQPMQVASPSSPPRSISQSNPPASSVANSTLTSSSMVSFDDLFSVDTSSECSTAITSHQFSVKSQLSSPKRIVTVSPTPSMHQVNRCPARHQASPMQQGYADSPTHAPMVGNNLVTPDYDRANHQQQRHHQQDWQAWPTPNKASRPNNFHNLTQYWKEQERLRLQRQQERLQARQLSHVVVHSSDNPAPVSPRQQIRHTNHADGLTC
uniref:Uncharacterized protein n=1 Tax=Craspedostauros australis TaxID=1486917 RepID=A0A7R9WQY2_9STRA